MAEANNSVHLAQLRTRLHCAARTLALQAAIKATKRRLQTQGLRVSQYSHRELVLNAEEYLAQHREELIADAKVVVERWREEGFFGKRAQKVWLANTETSAL